MAKYSTPFIPYVAATGIDVGPKFVPDKVTTPPPKVGSDAPPEMLLTAGGVYAFTATDNVLSCVPTTTFQVRIFPTPTAEKHFIITCAVVTLHFVALNSTPVAPYVADTVPFTTGPKFDPEIETVFPPPVVIAPARPEIAGGV